MKKKDLLSAQPTIQRPEDFERALLNGEVVLGCGSENGEGFWKYVFVLRCGFFFVFERRSKGLRLNMAEKFNPSHIAIAWQGCESLCLDKSGIADLDIRKLKYV